MPIRFEVDLRDLERAFRDRPSYTGENIIGEKEYILDSRNHEYSIIDRKIICHIQDFFVTESYHYRLIKRDFICFHFLLNGSVRFPGLDTRIKPLSRVRIAANVDRYSEILESPNRFRAVGLYTQKDRLVSEFGLLPDRLPPEMKAIFSPGGVEFARKLPLSPAACLAAEDIIGCSYVGNLRELYLKAKAFELIAITVQQLNNCSNYTVDLLNPSARLDRAVAAAALIYRREIANPPSVDEIARRVGLNRNSFTGAFRERFSEGPGGYSRRIRLEWAREQLASGLVPVAVIAAACGYTSHAAFSRAFIELFGMAISAAAAHRPALRREI
ncbi:MAG: AraC family transcriptional regulator [Alphaproteobacteria bacterium]|nr:MAG: AraC family transcriptional regulator [Alphaproteobacteria bacterium]